MRLNTTYVIQVLTTYLREQGFRVFAFPSYSAVDPTRLTKPCIVITPETTSVDHEVTHISVEDNLTLYLFTTTHDEKFDFVTAVVNSLLELEMVENPDIEFQFHSLQIPEITWDVQNDGNFPLSAVSVRLRHLSP